MEMVEKEVLLNTLTVVAVRTEVPVVVIVLNDVTTRVVLVNWVVTKLVIVRVFVTIISEKEYRVRVKFSLRVTTTLVEKVLIATESTCEVSTVNLVMVEVVTEVVVRMTEVTVVNSVVMHTEVSVT